jgi:hypothetical protein
MSATRGLMASRPVETSGGQRWVVVALCAIDAALLATSGAIHLHLWITVYRHVTVGHMNVLFFIQWLSCFVAAVAVLAVRRVIVVAGAAALMAGTITGFLIARYRTAGLFGFHLPFSSHEAQWALAVEITATVLLIVTGWIMARRSARTS